MIEWLREKFEMWVSILFILTLVIGISAGCIVGAIMREGVGFLVGLAIGCVGSIVFCVVVYGAMATFISIANSTNASAQLLAEIENELSAVEAMKNKLNALDEISSKLNSVGSAEK